MILPISNFQYTGKNNKNTSFNGRIDVIKCAFNKKKKVNTSLIKTYLEIDTKQVRTDLKNGINNPLATVNNMFERHKGGFLLRLAEKFNVLNFYGKISNKDKSRQLVYDMYHSVKYPSKNHKYIIDKTDYSLEQLNALFTLANDKPYLLKLTRKLLSTFNNQTKVKLSYETLMSFLGNQRGSKILYKHYSQYEHYIMKNASLYEKDKSAKDLMVLLSKS